MDHAGSRVQAHSRSSFFNVYTYLLAGIILLVAVFLFVTPAYAQEDVVTSEKEATVQQGETEEAPEEVKIDDEVTEKDLEVTAGGILPDNPLYGLKRLTRRVREITTFNPVKKAEIELKHANQELVEAQKVIDEKGDDAGAVKDVAKAIKSFEKKVARIEKKAGKLAKRKEAGDAGVDALLENMLDKQIKQQKVLENIQRKVSNTAPANVAARVIDSVQTAQDRAAGSAGSILGVEKDPERLAQHVDRVLSAQRGSSFKDLRNLEVLKRVGDHVDEHARAGLERAQKNALKRFAGEVGQLSARDRKEKFEKYVSHVGGDETRHMEIFDELKHFDELPEDVRKKMEVAKDIAARRFQGRLDHLEDRGFAEGFRQRAHERMFRRFKGEADVKKLRVIEELKQRVDHEGIREVVDEHHEEAVAKFKEAFTDDKSSTQVARFEELSKKMAENPDPTTFRLLQELENEVKSDPKKREFLEKMEREAKAQFAQRAAEEGSRFFEEISSSNPQDIEILKSLQRDFAQNPDSFIGPPPFGDEQGGHRPPFPPHGDIGRYFEQAINHQTRSVTDHLRNIDNPELFENFQKKFQHAPPEVLRELELRQGNFDDLFRDKRAFIQEQELMMQEEAIRRGNDHERRAREEAIRKKFENAQSDEERQALEQEVDELERELLNKQLDQRRDIFNKRIKFDPFCDENCQRQERQRFENKLSNDRNRFEEIGQFRQLERDLRDFAERARHEQAQRAFEEGDEGGHDFMPPRPIAPHFDDEKIDFKFDDRRFERDVPPRHEARDERPQPQNRGHQDQGRRPELERRDEQPGFVPPKRFIRDQHEERNERPEEPRHEQKDERPELERREPEVPHVPIKPPRPEQIDQLLEERERMMEHVKNIDREQREIHRPEPPAPPVGHDRDEDDRPQLNERPEPPQLPERREPVRDIPKPPEPPQHNGNANGSAHSPPAGPGPGFSPPPGTIGPPGGGHFNGPPPF